MKRLILIPLAILSLASCEFEFELDGMDTEPLLHFEAALHQNCDEDLKYAIQGLKAVSSGKYSDMEDITLQAYINGEKVDGYHSDGPCSLLSGEMNFNFLEPGDEISIKAECTGYPAISAKTVMPSGWDNLELEVKRTDESTISLDISFKDDAATEDFYGIGLIVETYMQQQIYGWTSVALRGPAVEGTGMTSYGEMRVSYIDPAERIINICSDHSFNGKEKKMSFIADCLESTDTEKRTYTVFAYKLSEEMYRYAVAQYDSSPWNNTLGFMGLSPVTFTYTNIQGGLGVLGCVNTRTYGPYPVP